MTHPQVDKRGAWTKTQKRAISILNHEHVLKIMHSLRFTHLIISWEVSKESVVNALKPPQFWASATRSRCSRKSWATCQSLWHGTGWAGGETFIQLCLSTINESHFSTFKDKDIPECPLGSHWVPAGHGVFTEDHTLDADHHEWIQKKKSFYLRKVNVEDQAHATYIQYHILYQHHWDWMKLGFLLKELKVSGNCHRLWWGLQGSFGPRSDKHVETHGFSLGGCVFSKPAFLLQGDVQICSPGCANCFRFYFGPSWWHCTQTVQQAAREARFQLSNLLHLLLLPFWKKPSKVLKNKPMSWNSPRVRLSKPFKTMKELVYL